MLNFLLLLLLAILTSAVSQNCTCVYYYLCRKGDRTVITDGEGIFDERIGGVCEKACNPKCQTDYTCCQLEGTSLKNPTTPDQPSTELKGCGFRNPDGVGFKISSDGDSFSNFGEFPWMIGILDDSGTYRCGGSLIHPSVVLTAAHCVIHRANYIVRAGEWDSSNTKEILKHKNIRVGSIKIHENYYPPLHHYDIALLFLNSSFDLKAHINTICLPALDVPLNNEKCFVSGWGKDQFGSKGQYPAILKRIKLPLVESNACQENLKKTKLGQNFHLHKSSICAGGEKDKDACIGDGGGPLFCPISGEKERYQQVGIVSWGVECNKENVPGVYANVPFLREWIDKQMEDNNLSKSSYLA